MTHVVCKEKLVFFSTLIVAAISLVYLYQDASQPLTWGYEDDSKTIQTLFLESTHQIGFPETTPPSISQTSSCIFPRVNVFDPQILKMAGLKQKTLRCDKNFMREITYIDGVVIRVNASKIDKSTGLSYCKYRNITRKAYQDYSVVFSKWSKNFTKSATLTDEHEFIHVLCYGGKNGSLVISKAYYSLVPKRKHLNALYNVKIQKRRKVFKPLETLSVIGVALDGLPRHQMIRGMSKTYSLLTKKLGAFDFASHGQLADNTFPNILGLLSGLDYAKVQTWWDFKKPEDAFDLLWHDFERAGYRTLYTEDNPRGAGFYWRNRSFIYPQTSYWNRPPELAMFDEPDFLRHNNSCFGARAVAEYQLEYLMRFLDTFPNKPVACMTFIIKTLHDDSTKAVVIDDYVKDFFQNLDIKGHLNKSLVIFFSDHGQRWGKIRQTYNGIVESRNPFLLVTFPPWFLKRYPQIARNLETNTRRLTSHFDTRQMLLDLLYFKSGQPTPPYRGKYGRSLFEEIPANRTCKDAGIPKTQCLCGQDVKRFINTSLPVAKSLGKALFKAVKQKSDPVNCEEYELDRILQVGVLNVPGANHREKKRFIVASVRLTVKPGGAIFEGNVHINLDTKKIIVNSDIERLTMYQGEVECQPTSREQMYCYCKGNIKK